MSKGEEKISIFSEKLNTYSLPPFFFFSTKHKQSIGSLEKILANLFCTPLISIFKKSKKILPFPNRFFTQLFKKHHVFFPYDYVLHKKKNT